MTSGQRAACLLAQGEDRRAWCAGRCPSHYHRETRIIALHRQIVRIDHERYDALPAEMEEKLFRLLLSSLKQLDAVVLPTTTKDSSLTALRSASCMPAIKAMFRYS